jgi:acyl carrier protein
MKQTNIDTSSTVERVTTLLRRTLALDDLHESTELIESELLDSVSVANLILELEEAFDISISESEVTPENFQTPSMIAALCARLAQR